MVWILGALLIAGVICFGMVILHGMALSPTGYVAPTAILEQR
ncbi:hypothetical protein [Lentibacter algarum]|nr:hypothetical protein [Lentibacter algarum]